MLKMMGAALIVAAFALAGSYKAGELRFRARLLGAMTSSLENLRGELCSRLTPLPEAAERLSRVGPAQTRDFWGGLCAKMVELGQRSFQELWEESVDGLELVSDEERAALAQLGATLGRYSASEQSAALGRCIELIGSCAQAARERAATGGKMYAGLGLAAGLLAAVTLV